MILAQYGTLKFYDLADYVHHEHTENDSIMVSYLTNKVPAFQFMLDSGVNANLKVIKYTDNVTVFETNFALTSLTGYKRVKYLGTTTSGGSEGWHQMQLTVGVGETEKTYYSDVFNWVSDPFGFLKITATSSNFALGRKQDYVFDMLNCTFECYLRVSNYEADTVNEEDSNEENGVIFPYYTGLSKVLSFIVEGTEYIYDFLILLRMLQYNGAVTISYLGDVYSPVDLTVEISEKTGNFDLVYSNLKFTPYNGIFTPINEI